MDLNGLVTYKKMKFYYTSKNNKKVVINSSKPIKLGLLVKVREEVLKDIQKKTSINYDIVFEFKTC